MSNNLTSPMLLCTVEEDNETCGREAIRTCDKCEKTYCKYHVVGRAQLPFLMPSAIDGIFGKEYQESLEDQPSRYCHKCCNDLLFDHFVADIGAKEHYAEWTKGFEGV